MPISTKTRWSQLRVGIMGIFALVILSALIFLISGSQSFFKSYNEIYTYLDDSAAIAESAPVRLNGILVGKVAKVELSGANAPNRVVRVTLKIDNQYLASIPADPTHGRSEIFPKPTSATCGG